MHLFICQLVAFACYAYNFNDWYSPVTLPLNSSRGQSQLTSQHIIEACRALSMNDFIKTLFSFSLRLYFNLIIRNIVQAHVKEMIIIFVKFILAAKWHLASNNSFFVAALVMVV